MLFLFFLFILFSIQYVYFLALIGAIHRVVRKAGIAITENARTIRF
jgi:hypothetical protein